jgi:chemotaxis protein MotB
VRRHRIHRRVIAPSHERWLVSYADFITLLFAVFTVLYASSTVDARKLSTMVESMQQVFAGQDAKAVAPPTPQPRTDVTTPGTDLEEVQRSLQLDLQGELVDGRVALEPDARGLVISILESASFPVGSADLPPAAEALLTRLSARLREIPNTIRVEGHTDDVPIQTARYASNWDLSTARATRVVSFLMESGRIDPVRLSAAGYSQFHPRVPNDSAADRARNRRVDLVILNTATNRAEEPGRQ